MTAEAADVICRKIDTSGLSGPLVLFNTLSWDRSDPICLPNGSRRDDVMVPACGWTVIDAGESASRPESAELTISKDGRHMRNRYWSLGLDGQGRIVELHDRLNNRDVLEEGAKGNEWQVFEDRPMAHDAWDIDLYYQEHRLVGPQCASIKVV